MYLRQYVVAAADTVAVNARAATTATTVALADAASDNIVKYAIADVRHLLKNPNVVGQLQPAVVGKFDDFLQKAMATGNAMRIFGALKSSGVGGGRGGVGPGRGYEDASQRGNHLRRLCGLGPAA